MLSEQTMRSNGEGTQKLHIQRINDESQDGIK